MDLISRQDAIDAKAEFLNPKVTRGTKEKNIRDREYAKGWNDCNMRWIDELERLPSTQLSRIERELHGKTPEEQYKILYQLMFEYANTFNDARRAVIDWLGE